MVWAKTATDTRKDAATVKGFECSDLEASRRSGCL